MAGSLWAWTLGETAVRIAQARRQERIIVTLGVLAFAVGPLVLYGETFTNRFGLWSDDLYVLGIWGPKPFRAILGGFFQICEIRAYRPIAQVISWVCYQIGGSSRFVYAGTSYLIQLCAAWALYCATARLSRSRLAGVLAAMLWASSSVNFYSFLCPLTMISDRPCMLFAALSLALFFSRRWKLAPVAVGFGLLSKEWCLVLPAILTAAWLLMLARTWELTGRLRRGPSLTRGWVIAACWLMVIPYIGLQYGKGVFAQSVMKQPTWAAMWNGLASDLYLNLGRSFEFILWPLLPNHTYDSSALRPNNAPTLIYLMASMLLLVLLVDAIALLRSRRTYIFQPTTYFCIAWFVIATMPLGLVVRGGGRPYMMILPSMALYCWLGVTLRRLQKAAFPRWPLPFFLAIAAGFFASLFAWYPYGRSLNHWARWTLAMSGRLERICKQIGDLPAGGPKPTVVLVGLSPGDPDRFAIFAMDDSYGFRIFYGRPVDCRLTATRAALSIGPDGRLRIRGNSESFGLENLRILEKERSHYVDITSALVAGSSSQNLAGRKTEPISMEPPKRRVVNLSRDATATASSEFKGAANYSPENIKEEGFSEWATAGPSKNIGAWVQLTWDYPVIIRRVEVENRVTGVDQVTRAHLVFSDGGSTVPVRSLNRLGIPLKIRIKPRTVTWIRFVVDAVGPRTQCAGLRGFRAFGEKAAEGP